jgi:hypothetical protein
MIQSILVIVQALSSTKCCNLAFMTLSNFFTPKMTLQGACTVADSLRILTLEPPLRWTLTIARCHEATSNCEGGGGEGGTLGHPPNPSLAHLSLSRPPSHPSPLPNPCVPFPYPFGLIPIFLAASFPPQSRAPLHCSPSSHGFHHSNPSIAPRPSRTTRPSTTAGPSTPARKKRACPNMSLEELP